MKTVIEPGATIGVLGSGQLGRMFGLAARQMGYRIHVLSPDGDSPAGPIADVATQAAYDDVDAVARFARGVDVVTFEFENIPAATIDVVERFAPVRPGGHVLHTTQQRLREKTFLRDHGLPVTTFRALREPADLEGVEANEFPAVLKTAAWGYDGKGQETVKSPLELASAWKSLGEQEAILERFVDFECELSVVAARTAEGEFACYGPMTNSHRDHILDLSVAPSRLPRRVVLDAIEVARIICAELDVVGVLCVEFFLARDGRLLVNELAPRPHNSGHLTIDAHATCQFTQQVRAVCGLPLGSTAQRSPAAMANLLGDLWETGEPSWRAGLAEGDVRLHLYGKRDPRRRRKMGHLTALASTPEAAAELACRARRALQPHLRAGQADLARSGDHSIFSMLCH